MTTQRRSAAIALLLPLMCLIAAVARAEPYLAVQQGYQCRQCHVNPTGGGLRNEFGDAFAQTQMPATHVDAGSDPWLGELNKYVSLGGNVRGDAAFTETPHEPSLYQYDLEEARVYLAVSPIPQRLIVYVDERLSPAQQVNEGYARYWTENQRWYVQAGKMYLPFGLRLQDNSAFTRIVPNIDMTTPDNGVEVGWESGPWSAQFAISNGTAGERENNNGKQYSLQTVFVTGRWRIGAAANNNNQDAGDRNAYALFGGLRTGPIAWLAEADLVTDETIVGQPKTDMVAGLLEANWLVRRGHNLKLTAEYYDPNRDVSGDNQYRYSLVYEYTPVQFLQLRAGARIYDGVSDVDFQNRKFYFLQLHGFF